MMEMDRTVAYEETGVSAEDDASQALPEGVEEHQQPDDGAEALSQALESLTDDNAAQGAQETEEAADETEDEQHEPREFSKALKGRVKASERKGYERGLEEAQRKWAEEKAAYEQRLARLEEIEMQDEAKRLAAEEKISEKLALRLIRAERGLKPAAQERNAESAPTRDGRGRFAPRTGEDAPKGAAPDGSAGVEERARSLYQQAQTIQKATGLDVLRIFQENEEAKRRVSSGEWDFADLASAYRSARQGADEQQETGRQPLASASPARSPNSTRIASRNFTDMTPEEFRRFDEGLKSRSYDVRR